MRKHSREFLENLTPEQGFELLAEGNLKMYEVAAIVGFKSQTNFGRSFLKQFGMSPSAYYQTMRGDGI